MAEENEGGEITNCIYASGFYPSLPDDHGERERIVHTAGAGGKLTGGSQPTSHQECPPPLFPGPRPSHPDTRLEVVGWKMGWSMIYG